MRVPDADRTPEVLLVFGLCTVAWMTACDLGFVWHPWALWTTLGFDFDEVLMICTGLAAVAWVITDYKRDRDLQHTVNALHEDLGRIKSMIGWDLPHALGERVTKLEAVVPDDLADRLATVEHESDLEKRVVALEEKECSEVVTAMRHAIAYEHEHTIAERVLVLETKRAQPARRKPAAKKGKANDATDG